MKERMERMKRLEECLKENNALCLLPLIEVVHNLDNMLQVGHDAYIKPNKKLIKQTEDQIKDIGHFREFLFIESPDDNLITNIEKEVQIRNYRRRLKRETDLFEVLTENNDIVSFINILKVTELEKRQFDSTKYISRDIIINTDVITNIINGNKATTYFNEIDAVKPIVTNRTVNIINSNEIHPANSPVPKIRFTCTDSELIKTKHEIIKMMSDEQKECHAKGEPHFLDLLSTCWCRNFNETLSAEKKRILKESYDEFHNDPKETNQAKVIKDYKVWNYILPKKLVENNIIL